MQEAIPCIACIWNKMEPQSSYAYKRLTEELPFSLFRIEQGISCVWALYSCTGYERGKAVCKMNPKIYEFDAVLQKVDGIDGAYIEFPWDVKEEFQKGRVCVHATFDNVAYDGSLVRMQTVRHILGVRKDIRAKIGKQPGDSINVTIQERIR